MKNNFGLLLKEKDPKRYIYGSSSLPKVILQPNGQWDAFLPGDETQNRMFESYDCTGYATNHALQILLKRLNSTLSGDKSDRWLALVADTRPPGNDPHTVAEAARKNGIIAEATLPNQNLDNVNEFYSFKGGDEGVCKKEGENFLFAYDIGHEYVFDNEPQKDVRIAKMKECLTYSPLGVSVSAWYLDGEVYVDKGESNNHWTVCYGYNDKGWKIFDSYDNTHKLLSFDHHIEVCKRYSLSPSTRQARVSLIFQILTAIGKLIGLLPKPKEVPIVAPEPISEHPAPIVEPEKYSIEIFCKAIQDFEGYTPNSRSYKNKNPGNTRYSPIGYAPMYGIVKKDPQGFAIFPTYALGWIYLKNLVHQFALKHPDWTLTQFCSLYAPASDNNDPIGYAVFIAKRLDVDIKKFTLKQLV